MSATRLHVRKGDRVQILSGKDRGKKGKVLRTFPRKNKVLVEGINMITKHARPTQKIPQGGIREMEAAINASKVMVICPSCQQPTRLFHRALENGKKVRGCKKCGEYIDK
ncbi:MAG: 50S ribosomal protein L24 [Firmicutes bacterium]|nr:50S ribosomal protein L24 [Bacillota bacterium]